MPNQFPSARRVAVAASFVVAASLAFVVGFWMELRLFTHFDWAEPVDLFLLLLQFALRLVVAVLLGVFAAKWVSRRLTTAAPADVPTRAGLPRKWIVAAVLLLYGVTWAFGVPAAHTALLWAGVEGRISFPADYRGLGRFSFGISFPVLPLVVATYHEYSAGSDTWNGWTVHFWYLRGAKELFRLAA